VFEHADWIGWAIGVAGLGYGIWTDRRARMRLDIAHAGLVSLKAAIEGPNKDRVITAINDLLSKLKR
jgi:hypothetical protein